MSKEFSKIYPDRLYQVHGKDLEKLRKYARNVHVYVLNVVDPYDELSAHNLKYIDNASFAIRTIISQIITLDN